MNRVYISGNLGQAPESRALSTGALVVRLSVAVNSGYKAKAGQWVEKTTWVECEAWAKTAERCRDFAKGTQVVIEGELECQEWTDKATQAKRSRMIVRVGNISALAPRQAAQDSESAPAPATSPAPPARRATAPGVIPQGNTEESTPF